MKMMNKYILASIPIITFSIGMFINMLLEKLIPLVSEGIRIGVTVFIVIFITILIMTFTSFINIKKESNNV